MKKSIQKVPYLLFLLVFPALAIVYSFLNNRSHKAFDISTSVDQVIPFLSFFIIPYIFWYVYIFIFLLYFLYKDTKVYLRTVLLIVVAELICFVIYFFFQTTVSRPIILGDTFLEVLVQWIYENDRPYNCFPSIHVLTTFAVMLASLHIKNKHLITNLCIHVSGSLIIISTLFVKQHVILDMVGSMFLVTFLYGITFELLIFRLGEKSEPVSLKNK
jgi:hypothetical protein